MNTMSEFEFKTIKTLSIRNLPQFSNVYEVLLELRPTDKTGLEYIDFLFTMNFDIDFNLICKEPKLIIRRNNDKNVVYLSIDNHIVLNFYDIEFKEKNFDLWNSLALKQNKLGVRFEPIPIINDIDIETIEITENFDIIHEQSKIMREHFERFEQEHKDIFERLDKLEEVSKIQHVKINGKTLPLPLGVYRVSFLKHLVQIPLDHDLDRIINGEIFPIDDGVSINVAAGDEFVSHPKEASFDNKEDGSK